MEAASLSHTPWAADDTFVLSGYGRRLVAWVLDLATVLTCFWIAIQILVAAQPAGGLLVLLAYLILPLYYTLGNGGSRGQTPGKRLAGIAVVHETKDRVGYARALGRWVTMTAVGLVPILSLFALFRPLWDEENRAFHDDVAKTRVVRVRR